MLEANQIIAADLQSIRQSDLPWDRFYGKTVVVTGANGFLPAYMVKTLLLINQTSNAPRIKVIGLVRNLSRAKIRFSDWLGDPNLELIEVDITKPIELESEAQFIIHAASQASPKYYGTDPVGTLNANTIGTYHLLQYAVKSKSEGLLFFSSSEVYGAVGGDQLLAEDVFGAVNPATVRACYAESKRMGETMCVAFAAQYQVPAMIARPFHTYGPGLALDDGRVFADFVANVVKGESIVMNSDGAAIRSFCYLADATVGFFTVLLKGTPAEAYNVGNPDGAVSIKELAEILVQLYPEKQLKATFKESVNETYLKSTYNRLCPDITKLQALGWKPATLISDGFKRTIESFLI